MSVLYQNTIEIKNFSTNIPVRKELVKMDRPTKVAIYWSVVTSALIFLYWLVFYLKTGTIPNNFDLAISGKCVFVIPVSQIFDFLIGPTICFLYLLEYKIGIL